MSGLVKEKNLLARSAYQYDLKEVKEPNLFREFFPYSEVPRIPFNHRIVPMNTPREFWITDTTFRDGQQARPPYSVKQIVDIYDLLHRLSGPHGVIRQCEFFLYNKKDREAVEKCRDRGYRYPEITGWIRAVKEDFKLVKEIGLKETGILTSCSDYHIFLKLGLTRQEAVRRYLEIVQAALEVGVVPRCHLEDITRSDYYGMVIPFVQKLMELSEESGIPVKIRACDTMGYGVPYVGTSTPRSVPELIYGLVHYGGVPSECLEWHGHNDFHKGLVNAATAWLYGCCAANGVILGFGERTGNTPVEGLVMEYIGLRGETNGIDTTAITDLAEYFRRELGVRIPANYPFVGSDFNNTSAGIHADGALKNEEIYNIFDTVKILKRPMGITITDKSGIAGIAYWINNYLRLEGDRKVDKKHPGIAKIYKWVMEQYESGRLTSISTDEMIVQARKYLPENFESDFDRLRLKAKEIVFPLVETLVVAAPFRILDPKGMEIQMQKIIDENPFIQFAYVVDQKGCQLTHNVTQIADRAKYSRFGIGEDFSDRVWFLEPLRDGETHITDFYKSVITGALCVTVSIPIRNERDEIVGVCGLDLRFEDLLKIDRKVEVLGEGEMVSEVGVKGEVL
ncbi:MAG: histone-lysine N-methyltransferase [Nitrospirae bacterium]|nr:histone-lysine N-methyltransferase [Nitrospirota bacterium]